MRTKTVQVNGTDVLLHVVMSLVQRSQWFQVEPLPADFFHVTVKEENEDRLRAIVIAANKVTRI